jgi:hypothetical protein
MAAFAEAAGCPASRERAGAAESVAGRCRIQSL